MCGIVGYVGERDAVGILLDGLRRVEYRGYDSAGIGVLDHDRLQVLRSVGKITDLERALACAPISGGVGIGHTRWATHGKPSDENAHPHTDCTRTVAVVHNGIIENHAALKAELQKAGHTFGSETDTEVIAHLIEDELVHDLETATARAVRRLRGTYALGVVGRRAPGTIIATRKGGPPLVIGMTDHGYLVASDVAALLDHTRDVVVLEEGELAVLSRERMQVRSHRGVTIPKRVTRVPWDATAADKRGYPHFMLKEIHEQPRAVEETLRACVDPAATAVRLPMARLTPSRLARVRRVVIVGCGTSWHAGLVGKYMIETLTGLPVEVDVASEFRYRVPVVDWTTLCIAISQSGETADTLGAVSTARAKGAPVLAVCNVAGSTITREADDVVLTRSGPEFGVASTKAFTSQLAVLLLLGVHLGRIRGTVSRRRARQLLREAAEVPLLLDKVLAVDGQVRELAERFQGCANALYLGRGINYPLALEGALKLKEISYVHAEGYPAGEMKHGPIALIDATVPVIVVAPQGGLYEKTLGAIEEIKARSGIVIALATDGDETIVTKADHVIAVPHASEILTPLVAAIPLQLFAYHVAVLRKCDVDQPRNLAKSVTVE